VNKDPEGEDLFTAMVAKRTKCSVLTVQVEIGQAKNHSF
jgi:hypothetical protein